MTATEAPADLLAQGRSALDQWMDAADPDAVGAAAEALVYVRSALLEAEEREADRCRVEVRDGVFVPVSGLDEIDAADLAREPIEPVESLPLLGESGYVIRGYSHLLCTLPKGGKTSLLAACLESWIRLGYRVLYLTEEGRGVWQRRLARMAEPPPPGSLSLVMGMGSDPDRLLERAVRGQEQVVIVDTLRYLFGIENENDNSEVARAMRPWIAGLAGRTTLFVHHARKSAGDAGRGVAGAGALVASVDRILEIRHEGEGDTRRRRIDVLSRIETPASIVYEMTADGDLVIVGRAGEVRASDRRERVLAAVGSEWVTYRAIHEAIEPRLGEHAVREELAALRSLGRIERDPAEDRAGARYRYRRVQTSSAQLPLGIRTAEEVEEEVI